MRLPSVYVITMKSGFLYFGVHKDYNNAVKEIKRLGIYEQEDGISTYSSLSLYTWYVRIWAPYRRLESKEETRE